MPRLFASLLLLAASLGAADDARRPEVERAIVAARQEAAAGNHKRALEILEGANGYLPNNTAAQKVRDDITIARQEINLHKEAGTQSPDQIAREEVVGLAKVNQFKINKASELIDQAESLARKGSALLRRDGRDRRAD